MIVNDLGLAAKARSRKLLIVNHLRYFKKILDFFAIYGILASLMRDRLDWLRGPWEDSLVSDKLNDLICDTCGAVESKGVEVWERGPALEFETICSNCYEKKD